MCDKDIQFEEASEGFRWSKILFKKADTNLNIFIQLS